jgi:ribosome-binding protein aMBF1 (putative translation factor)
MGGDSLLKAVGQAESLLHELKQIEFEKSQTLAITGFGIAAKQRRKDRGLSVNRLADLTGLSEKTIRAVEISNEEALLKSQVKTLSKIASALGLKLCVQL